MTEPHHVAQRLLRAMVLLALVLVARGLFRVLAPVLDGMFGPQPALVIETALTVAAWLALANLVIRTLDRFLWPRIARRPPRLLTDLVAGVVWFAVALVVIGRVFGVPVTGILTTSGVAVAVLGFALRDMLASLFSGIALNLEGPHRIGDWLEVAPGTVGRVVEVGWLTTRLVTLDGIGLVVPNAQLATRGFANFNRPSMAWRDQVQVTLSYDVSPVRAERILLAAAAEVDQANAAGRAPDAKIASCGEGGVVWNLRYWLADYRERTEIRHLVHAAVLRHLYKAGLSPAHRKLDLYHAPMPARTLDDRTQLDALLLRSDLFGHLPDEDLSTLAANARRLRVSAGTPVVRQGEPGSSLFIVVEGVLDVYVETGSNGSRKVHVLRPGDMFGEFSLLTGAPRSATVTARTASLVFEITKTNLMPVLEHCPELADAMSRILVERQAERDRPQDEPADRGASATIDGEHSLVQRIRSFFGLPQ